MLISLLVLKQNYQLKDQWGEICLKVPTCIGKRLRPNQRVCNSQLRNSNRQTLFVFKTRVLKHVQESLAHDPGIDIPY